MRKSNDHPMDKDMMKNLVKYVIGKPFPRKHTVMDVDDVYGIRVLSPSQILESTKGTNNNTRLLITFQNRENCKIFDSKEAPGFWKSTTKLKGIFDANKRHIGNIKIGWYYYYNVDDGRDKSSSRLRKSEWQIREYYLAPTYLPQSKVERKNVLLTMMIKTKAANNNNNDKSDDKMQIVLDKQEIMQSLQCLQL
ncbi:uncharacterized protein LOC125845833 [Solanum stenotomum]|uniref:uncharacterized protein LOC125845831 n=1 Tax=Solanum stenotomum TaxID=172797 RepID=UPI0020D0BE16|nr:uncharacterized protein LOC125845831 [Solanum stenotomum]XP_049381303.1 uncharacterized protein LOC125845833 [Solanum stenotomum]